MSMLIMVTMNMVIPIMVIIIFWILSILWWKCTGYWPLWVRVGVCMYIWSFCPFPLVTTVKMHSFIHSFIHSFRCFVYCVADFLLSLSFHPVFILFAVIYSRLHILGTNTVFVVTVKYCVLFSIHCFLANAWKQNLQKQNMQKHNTARITVYSYCSVCFLFIL